MLKDVAVRSPTGSEEGGLVMRQEGHNVLDPELCKSSTHECAGRRLARSDSNGLESALHLSETPPPSSTRFRTLRGVVGNLMRDL